MKTTRIFLILSPLMLLCPPLLPLQDSVAWGMIGYFYGTLLRRFPWNILMAFLCYSYANSLGRDAFRWAGGSFLFPFFAPVVLAFMSPKTGSAAEAVQMAHARLRPAAVKGAAGGFSDRFPLLQRRLAEKPEPARIEQMSRFTPVQVNFEFYMPVEREALDRVLSEAQTRQFTVWTDAGETDTYLYGAGVVQPAALEEATNWLRRSGASGRKLEVAWRQPDGTLKFLEYYPA